MGIVLLILGVLYAKLRRAKYVNRDLLELRFIESAIVTVLNLNFEFYCNCALLVQQF